MINISFIRGKHLFDILIFPLCVTPSVLLSISLSHTPSLYLQFAMVTFAMSYNAKVSLLHISGLQHVV